LLLLFTDKIDVLKSNIANLEDKLEKLERKNEESINKLTILTNFFKEQEKHYLKYVFYFIFPQKVKLIFTNSTNSIDILKFSIRGKKS
jgi:hypothetical protein